ncbi:MAG: hypothetical protein LIO65_00285 [Odoribacter sp.]|nr:hypothetical protein [Odoribacter sp.]
MKIYITILFMALSFTLWAQQGVKVKGRILGPDTKPIPGAVISGAALDATVQTDEQGFLKLLSAIKIVILLSGQMAIIP